MSMCGKLEDLEHEYNALLKQARTLKAKQGADPYSYKLYCEVWNTRVHMMHLEMDICKLKMIRDMELDK